jgi:opine dehydrogenase
VNIAVLGGGPGASATAADLALAGHRVRLWRRREADFAPIRQAGGITLVEDERRATAPLDRLTADLADAVAGAEVVIISIPAAAHPEVAGRLSTALEAEQIVLLTAGLLGSYVIARDIARARGRIPFALAETGTVPCRARWTGPAEVAVSARAVNLSVGVFPAAHTAETLERLRPLVPALHPCRDALDVALTNPGPAIHPPLVLLNAAAIEAGGPDTVATGMTPGVRRLIEAVDGERVAIRAGLGYPAPHYALSQPGDDARASEVLDGARAGWASLLAGGPFDETVTFEHRSVTEDAALGLSLFESAGRLAGADTPVIGGLLSVFQALLGRDLRATGRGLDRLGLGDFVRREIRDLLHEGWRSPLWRRALSG